MTDATTDRHAKPVVIETLKRGTKEQRRTYMARGVPQALIGTYLLTSGDAFGETVTRIQPSLRGIIVGEPVGTAEEAVLKATEVRDRMLAEGPLEPLDEVALGIDDEARDLEQRFQDVGARIDTIVHIGTMQDGDPNETLTEMIENLGGQDIEALTPHFPFLPALAKLREEGDDAGADDDADPMDDDEFVQEFLSRAHDHGAAGFLVEVSVPEMRPTAGGGWSIHGGIRNLAVRYGSTYATACAHALEWAERRIAEMRAVEAA